MIYSPYADLPEIMAPEDWTSDNDPEGYGENRPKRSGPARSTLAERVAQEQEVERERETVLQQLITAVTKGRAKTDKAAVEGRLKDMAVKEMATLKSDPAVVTVKKRRDNSGRSISSSSQSNADSGGPQEEGVVPSKWSVVVGDWLW